MCVCVEKLISITSEQSLDFVNHTTMGNIINHKRKTCKTNCILYKYGIRKVQEKGIMGVAIPKLSQLYILRHERAKLIDSNTITFGNECVRLVNIVFQASQIFPTIMGTYDKIKHYLREELIRQYPNKHFHIIIGKNDGFSFAISDCDHFAQIKQEQYQVLIFSTESHKTIKYDTHDANNQMQLQWTSVVIKRINN